MDEKTARYIYNRANDNGDGFALTEDEGVDISESIQEAGLEVIECPSNGLWLVYDAADNAHYLVGGDGMQRNAWAVVVPPELMDPNLRCDVYTGARAYYEGVIDNVAKLMEGED